MPVVLVDSINSGWSRNICSNIAWFHRPASRLPFTNISAITPLSIELSIGSIKVPKRRGGTVPRFPAGLTRISTTFGIGLDCVIWAMEAAEQSNTAETWQMARIARIGGSCNGLHEGTLLTGCIAVKGRVDAWRRRLGREEREL